MGKSNRELPSIAASTVSSEQITETIAGELTIKVPTFIWEDGYARRCLDVRLTGTQAMTLKSIQLGLEKREAQLENGRFVANPVDAIRWMLESAE